MAQTRFRGKPAVTQKTDTTEIPEALENPENPELVKVRILKPIGSVVEGTLRRGHITKMLPKEAEAHAAMGNVEIYVADVDLTEAVQAIYANHGQVAVSEPDSPLVGIIEALSLQQANIVEAKDPTEEESALMSETVAKLKEMAEDMKIDVPQKATKKEIVALIEAGA